MKFAIRMEDLGVRVLMTFAVTMATSVAAHLYPGTSLSDGCDWSGSGLTNPPGQLRGVTPVYLRCSQGHVEWVYPRGALRVLLRLGASGREFRGCVRVAPHNDGARMFLEGPRSLTPLFADDGGSSPMRCFFSSDGQAALYVEATVSSGTRLERDVASFSYDLQQLPKGHSHRDPQEECRPCSPDELVRLYCTSDFVARGIITGVQNNEALSRGEVSARVSSVYRQLHPVFNAHATNNTRPTNDSHYFKYNSLAMKNGIDDVHGATGYLYGTVYVPLHCGAKHGTGEFILMGRFVLGEPMLTCAPRLEDWVLVRRVAVEEGTAQCALET